MTQRLPSANFLPIVLSGRTVHGALMAGSPRRIVLDSISAPTVTSAIASYEESKSIPHFTLNFLERTITQHIDLDETAVGVTKLPVEPHRIGATCWVNVLKPAGLVPDDDQSYWLGETVGLIAKLFDVQEYWELFPVRTDRSYRNSEMPLGEWRKFEGICAAAHVPLCARYGPGEIGLDAFADGLNGIGIPREVKSVEVESADVSASVLEPEVVDPNLLEKLAAELVSVDEPEQDTTSVLGKFPGRTVKLGSGGKAVSALREAFGLDDGKFDDELNDLVTYAQEVAGVTPDGIVDADTWTVLDEQLVEERNSQ